MKFKLEYGILIIGIVLLCILVSPLFKGPGLPVNIDLAPQYVRLMCLTEHGTAPNNWCPYINAGTPTSQYYYPVFDQLMAWISNFINPYLVYKIILILALLLPAIAIWLWLKNKYPIGAAIGFTTYLCFSAGWHASGFQETILVGFWHYMLSVGAMLISCYYFNKMLKFGNGYDSIFFLLSLLFILHPMTIFTAIVCYIGLCIYHYKDIKENSWEFIIDIVLAFGLTAFYWLPFISKMVLFPSSIGAMLDWNLFMSYIINPVNKILLVVGLLGIGVILFEKDKNDYPLLVMFGSLCLFGILDFIKSPLNKIQIGVRIGAFLIPVIIMLYALTIDYIFKYTEKYFKKNDIIKYLVIIVALLFIGSLFLETKKESESITLSSDDIWKDQMLFYQDLSTLPSGRILMEDMLPYTGTHITSMMPILTKKEIISFGPIIFPKFNLLDNTGQSLFNTNIEEWQPNKLNEVLNRYNIKWMLVQSNNYYYLLNNTMKFESQIIGPFALFDTGINASYFASDDEIIYESYNGWKGEVLTNGKKVMFKVNYYPNWKAYQNNKNLKTYECDGMVCVNNIDNSKIEFKYESTFADKVGVIISIIFLIFVILLIFMIAVFDGLTLELDGDYYNGY